MGDIEDPAVLREHGDLVQALMSALIPSGWLEGRLAFAIPPFALAPFFETPTARRLEEWSKGEGRDREREAVVEPARRDERAHERLHEVAVLPQHRRVLDVTEQRRRRLHGLHQRTGLLGDIEDPAVLREHGDLVQALMSALIPSG
ncbi:MAG: hypothetical protein AAFQ05_16040, partial [Pseudomonadota bacterium]